MFEILTSFFQILYLFFNKDNILINYMPPEIYFEIFKYLSPKERIIFGSCSDETKRIHENFVKYIIWPKLFKALRPRVNIEVDEVEFNNESDEISDIKFKFHNFIINEIEMKIINETYPIEYNENGDIFTKLYEIDTKNSRALSNLIILGKNITKVEMRTDYYSSYSIICRKFYLKKDIVKFDFGVILPYIFVQCHKIYIKIYGSVDKVFVKEYTIDKNCTDTINTFVSNTRNCIFKRNTNIQVANRLQTKLMFCNGMCVFRYCTIDKTCIDRARNDKAYGKKLCIFG